MSIRINNIKLSINDDKINLREIAIKKLRIKGDTIRNFKIIKESIDARKKNGITFIYSVLVDLHENEEKVIARLNNKDIQYIKADNDNPVKPGIIKLDYRPIIVGTGPAGLFAGLYLASLGYRPIVFERGEDVDTRSKKVNCFWKKGELDTECNVQFGEGGAGTFSDGKLTTRINDRRCNVVLDEFVEAGAPSEILYHGKPHIGTDRLKQVIKNMRTKIISMGGQVRFNSKLTDIKVKDGKVVGVLVNDTQFIPCEVLVLATGHSARDTYEMLLRKGINMVQKPFSIGVRIEHSQKVIDEAQYGGYAGHPRLKAADYQLVYKGRDRTCYSFCMCPGGVVVAAASENDTIVTNGMSEFARNKKNANSALVVSVGPGDFGSSHPLAGVEYQRNWERLAFIEGGKDLSAPMQRVTDFIDGKRTRDLNGVKILPSYTGNIRACNLENCLPNYVINTMREGLGFFSNIISGYISNDVLMTGVETRTSAPVRILRGEKGESINMEGLYPTGEGAGYAGGIISAAVDGIKIAEAIVEKYAPFD